MTCIVGYKGKKNNKVYIRGDSCLGSDSITYTLKNNCKVFKPRGNNNFLIGISGSARSGQLIKQNLVISEDIKMVRMKDMEDYIINMIIPQIKDILQINDRLSKGKSDIYITMAYKDRMWIIDDEFSVSELMQDYVTDGSGSAYAEGSLKTTYNMNMDIKDKILMGLRSGSINTFVAPPFYILNTKDDEVLKYEE